MARPDGTVRGLGSERNIVVHVVATTAATACGDRAARRRARWTRDAEIAARLVGETTTAATAAVKHGENRVEALQHHFGGVFLHAALVGPFAGLQLTLDIHLGALLQIL